MKNKMKAYRLLDWETKANIVEIDIPKTGNGEVLVKVAGNGLCHSDISMSQMPKEMGEQIGWKVPFTFGHEIGGWIEEIGLGVTGFKKGDPVVLTSSNFCGSCEYCLIGQTNNCEHASAGRGYGRDGGLAEYVLVENPNQIIKLDKLDPTTSGALTDAGATSYHAVKSVLPKLVPGSTAIVIGAGGLGSFAIQFIRVLSPARIIAIDMNENKLEIAREYGAHDTLVGVNESTLSEILKLTNNRGAEVVLDFAGFDSTIETGLAAVRKSGAFGLIGAGRGSLNKPWYGSFPFDGQVFNFQGGSLNDTKEVIKLAEAGLIRNEVEYFSLEDIDKAYEKMEKGELKGRAVVKL